MTSIMALLHFLIPILYNITPTYAEGSPGSFVGSDISPRSRPTGHNTYVCVILLFIIIATELQMISSALLRLIEFICPKTATKATKIQSPYVKLEKRPFSATLHHQSLASGVTSCASYVTFTQDKNKW